MKLHWVCFCKYILHVLETLIKPNNYELYIIYNYVADLGTKEKVNSKNYKTVLAASKNFVVSHIKD